MAKALDQEMYTYFTQLDEAEKKSVIQMLRTLLRARKIEYKPQSLADYNQELEEANAQIEAGHFITHEDAQKEMLKW